MSVNVIYEIRSIAVQLFRSQVHCQKCVQFYALTTYTVVGFGFVHSTNDCTLCLLGCPETFRRQPIVDDNVQFLIEKHHMSEFLQKGMYEISLHVLSMFMILAFTHRGKQLTFFKLSAQAVT